MAEKKVSYQDFIDEVQEFESNVLTYTGRNNQLGITPEGRVEFAGQVFNFPRTIEGWVAATYESRARSAMTDCVGVTCVRSRDMALLDLRDFMEIGKRSIKTTNTVSAIIYKGDFYHVFGKLGHADQLEVFFSTVSNTMGISDHFVDGRVTPLSVKARFDVEGISGAYWVLETNIVGTISFEARVEDSEGNLLVLPQTLRKVRKYSVEEFEVFAKGFKESAHVAQAVENRESLAGIVIKNTLAGYQKATEGAIRKINGLAPKMKETELGQFKLADEAITGLELFFMVAELRSSCTGMTFELDRSLAAEIRKAEMKILSGVC